MKGPRFWTPLSLWFPDLESTRGKLWAPLRFLSLLVPLWLRSGLSFATMRGAWAVAPRIERWTAGFDGVAPNEVYALLTEQLPKPNAVRVAIAEEGEVTYHLVVTHVAYARRKLERARGTAFHDLLMIPKKHRGGGMALHVLANAVALYRRLGITRVDMVAGLSHGSPYWSKLGVRPVDHDEWDRLRMRLERKLDRRFGKASDQARNDARELLRNAEPRAIWQLRRLVDSVTGRRLGYDLLRGERWRGMLDLNDPDAVRRLVSGLEAAGRTV